MKQKLVLNVATKCGQTDSQVTLGHLWERIKAKKYYKEILFFVSRLYTTMRGVCGLQDLKLLEKSKAITPFKGARAETR